MGDKDEIEQGESDISLKTMHTQFLEFQLQVMSKLESMTYKNSGEQGKLTEENPGDQETRKTQVEDEWEVSTNARHGERSGVDKKVRDMEKENEYEQDESYHRRHTLG